MARLTKHQRLWIGWFATNSVGWFLCVATLVATGMATGDAGETLALLPVDLPGYILMYSSNWGVLALIQSWLLSRSIPDRLHLVLRWVGACMLGWNVFWLLMYMSMSSSRLAGLAEIVIGACSVGILQSLALRPFLANTRRWMLATVGTIGLLLVVLWAFDEVVLRLFGGGSALLSLNLLLPGCLYGAFTGWVMIVLLNQTAVQSIPI